MNKKKKNEKKKRTKTTANNKRLAEQIEKRTGGKIAMKMRKRKGKH